TAKTAAAKATTPTAEAAAETTTQPAYHTAPARGTGGIAPPPCTQRTAGVTEYEGGHGGQYADHQTVEHQEDEDPHRKGGKPGRHEKAHGRQRQQHDYRRVAIITTAGRTLCRRRQRFAIDQLDQAVNAGHDAARIVALLEAGGNLFTDNPAGQQVGHRAFKAIAHFDAQAAIVFGHQQQNAVIDTLTANTPLVEHPSCVAFDGVFA